MGRILKRVPLDFNAPLNEIWRGYLLTNATDENYKKFPVKSCDECRLKNSDKKNFCYEEKTPYCVWYNPKWTKLWHEEPPKGEGYQMWENTTEGSPQTPVFKTLKELAIYCEKKITYFGTNDFISRIEWYDVLSYNLSSTLPKGIEVFGEPVENLDKNKYKPNIKLCQKN